MITTLLFVLALANPASLRPAADTSRPKSPAVARPAATPESKPAAKAPPPKPLVNPKAEPVLKRRNPPR